MNGVEATRQVLANQPEVRVIGLSMHNDDQVETAMLQAGAAAYPTKHGRPADLLSTIREVVGEGER